MLAAVHQIPAPPLAGHVSASWIDGAGPEHSSLQALLRAESGAANVLLHLDYHLLNVLTDGRQITAVLDWANAAAGDPRADLARMITILRLDSADLALPRWMLGGVLRSFEAGLRHGYAGVTGPVSHLAPFYAWAGAVMERDLSGRMGPAQRVRIRRWTRHWMQRAACAH